jgi:hypothetical protein
MLAVVFHPAPIGSEVIVARVIGRGIPVGDVETKSPTMTKINRVLAETISSLHVYDVGHVGVPLP